MAEKSKEFTGRSQSYKRQAGGGETTPICGPESLMGAREEESSPEKEYFKNGERSSLAGNLPQRQSLPVVP